MVNCTPLRVVQDIPESRARLGGLAPSGVSPRLSDEETGYLATIPISEASDVSFFLSTSFTDPKRSIFHLAHQIHDGSCGFVEAVIHAPSQRSERSQYWELVSPVSLRLLPPVPDADPYFAGCRFLGHKFEGLPG